MTDHYLSRGRTAIAAIAGLALLNPLLFAGSAEAAKPPKKVASKVTFTGLDASNVDHVKISGKVKSSKKACRKGRTVKLRQVDQGLSAGKDKTNTKGKWTVVFDGNKIDPGKFKATVTKKTIHQHGKRIICKSASATKNITP